MIMGHGVDESKTLDLTAEASNLKTSQLASIPCEDCNESGCEHGEGCSHHLCSFSSFLPLASSGYLPSPNQFYLVKSDWYIYANYLSPFLDPALKPPLFS